ncbi:hypothetical protein [Scandinavium sp.]|uniref:hypothetical protein n=1 Tax=Scandinavium sp. TaxID=2830653 RepID=UPI0028A0DB19|nr:hypothetical protein [Scandinavium sp.]
MGVKTTHPPVRGMTPVTVLLVFALVLMRSTTIVIKATGAAIVTWCLLSIFRLSVFSHEGINNENIS